MGTPLFHSLDKKTQETLEHHLDLVIQANERVNLTRIDKPEEGMLLHIEDSLAGLQDLQEAPEGLYGDLGAGGGYPGIPLAVVSGRETVLIDARKKKADELDKMIATLGLEEQVSTFAGRAELLARKQRGSFTALTARALAPLSVLMELASPLLRQGGRLICYKANVSDEEAEHASSLQDKTGMRFIGSRSFDLEAEEPIHRSIYGFEKVSEGSLSLPRQEGAAQKNPL